MRKLRKTETFEMDVMQNYTLEAFKLCTYNSLKKVSPHQEKNAILQKQEDTKIIL